MALKIRKLSFHSLIEIFNGIPEYFALKSNFTMFFVLSATVKNTIRVSEPCRSYYANGFAMRAGVCYDRSQDRCTTRILT